MNSRRRRLLFARVAAVFLVGVAVRAQADDFTRARLATGIDAYASKRFAEASDQFRIACFGLLDQPVALTEGLVRLALAQDAAGRSRTPRRPSIAFSRSRGVSPATQALVSTPRPGRRSRRCCGHGSRPRRWRRFRRCRARRRRPLTSPDPESAVRVRGSARWRGPRAAARSVCVRPGMIPARDGRGSRAATIPAREELRRDLDESRFRLGPLRIALEALDREPRLQRQHQRFDDGSRVRRNGPTSSSARASTLPLSAKLAVRADLLPAYIWYAHEVERRAFGGQIAGSFLAFCQSPDVHRLGATRRARTPS